MIAHFFPVIFLFGFLRATNAQVPDCTAVAEVSEPREMLAATSVGARYALFAGGVNRQGDIGVVDAFDAATGAWSVLGNLSVPRFALAAAAARDVAYFGGGWNTSIMNGVVDVVDVWNATENSWSQLQLSEARSGLAAATVGGRHVIFAGGYAMNGHTATVDRWDCAASAWATAPGALSEARTHLAATSVGDVALFGGGFSFYLPGFFATVDVWNATDGNWTVGNLSQSRRHLAAASAAGRWAVFGGGERMRPNNESAVVDVFDVVAGTWTATQLSQARTKLAAAAAGSVVFFAGGTTDALGESGVVDIYDAATSTWTANTLALSVPRWSLAGTSVGAEIVFAEGWGNHKYVTTVDRFYACPRSRTESRPASTTAEIRQTRATATAAKSETALTGNDTLAAAESETSISAACAAEMPW